MTFKRSTEFELICEVSKTSSDFENIKKYYGFHKEQEFGSTIVLYFFGSWQNMKWLAQVLETKFKIMAVITYKGKYSKDYAYGRYNDDDA